GWWGWGGGGGWKGGERDGIVLAILDEGLEGSGVAVWAGVAGDIDRVAPRPDRRQRRVELLHGRRREVGERAAEVAEPVHGQHTDAAAIGQDREPLAPERLQASEPFRG